jgi:hypothetical protein
MRSGQYQRWKSIATVDEAWFYFSNQHEQIWLRDHKHPATIEHHAIGSPKTIQTLVWNPHELHLACVLSKKQMWTGQYFIDYVLAEICSRHGIGSRRRLVVHADNAKPQVAKGSINFWMITT